VLKPKMGVHLFDIHHLIAQQVPSSRQLLLATPVVLWAGWPFFAGRAAASGKHRSPNMFALIALGTGAAWLYSRWRRACSHGRCEATMGRLRPFLKLQRS